MSTHKYISFDKSTKSWVVKIPTTIARKHTRSNKVGKRRDLDAALLLRNKVFGELGILALIEDVQEDVVTPTFLADGDKATAFCKGPRVRTVEDLIAHCEIDTNIWEVEKPTINCWDMTNRDGQTYQNFQVKATFKRRFCEIDFDYLSKVLKIAGIKKVKRPVIGEVEKTGVMLEINIFDVHVGKLCWAPEVGENYDLSIARQKFMQALYGLISLSSAWKPEKIVFPIGGDFFNIDNLNATTTKGTPQQMEGRYPKMVATGVALIIEAIDVLREIAPVEVVNIPGNHDEASDYWLAHLISYRYDMDDRVTVDDSPIKRKYIKFYDCMMGLAHGDGVKKGDWGKTAAAEAPVLWGETVWREYHLGHFHHETKDEGPGLTVRWLGSISPADKWHFDNGYVGTRQSASAFVWAKGRGVIADLTCNL